MDPENLSLTGLSLKPKPRKSSAMTRWKCSVRGPQICMERGDKRGSYWCTWGCFRLIYGVVPCSSRSWRWGSRAAEWLHLSSPKHHKSLRGAGGVFEINRTEHRYLHAFSHGADLCRRPSCPWRGRRPRRCATSAGQVRAEGEGCAGTRPPAGCRLNPHESTTLSSWAQRWGSLIPAPERQSLTLNPTLKANLFAAAHRQVCEITELNTFQ